MVSQSFKDEAFRENTDDGTVILVTIEHSTLTSPLRFAWHDQNITSRGNVYSPFPMKIELPQIGNNRPRARLVFMGPAIDVVPYLRAMTNTPKITLEVVRMNDPDTVEKTFPNLELTNIEITDGISGELTYFDDKKEQFPKDSIIPSTFPGSFP